MNGISLLLRFNTTFGIIIRSYYNQDGYDNDEQIHANMEGCNIE